MFAFVFRKAALTTTSFDKKVIPGYIILVVSRQMGIYLCLALSIAVVSVTSLLSRNKIFKVPI